MVKTESKTGRSVLTVAHCAGMVDLVALPVWVGTLIQHYQLDAQQAGALVTLFLAGAVAASAFFAPRFNRIGGRVAAAAGFGLAALAFMALSLAQQFATMAAVHAAAGLATGCALSFTHGTIGRSANPHRLFSIVGMGLGVFGIAFFAATPQLVAVFGGAALFRVFAGVMALAALLSALAFPVPPPPPPPPPQPPALPAAGSGPVAAIPAAVWFAVFGVACMGLVQSMTFSFVERIGTDRGFGFAAVTGVLIALGFVNLLPSPLAALLQRRWPAHKVMLAGPVLHAALALLITQSPAFAPWATGAVLFAGVMIFTHTFAFGVLAALDPSGRAVAATPAMLMLGAAIGPLLGGTLVKLAGYGSLGVAAVLAAVLAVAAFSRLRPQALGRPVVA